MFQAGFATRCGRICQALQAIPVLSHRNSFWALHGIATPHQSDPITKLSQGGICANIGSETFLVGTFRREALHSMPEFT